MLTQWNVLGYRVDLYFHEYKLPIEVDGNGHGDRSIDYEIKRQKVIKQGLGCKFIRIHAEKDGIDAFRTISEIFNYIK